MVEVATWARGATSPIVNSSGMVPLDMQSLLDWLSTQVTVGAVAVETTKQVIGGTYVTPFCC